MGQVGNGKALTPVLLADATWYGTLAAIRDLGPRGVPVTLASDVAVAPARWSRYVNRIVRCPPTKDSARFGAWLHDFGDREPGHVLYPTSDDAAWSISNDRDALSKKFRLYSPSVETLAALLDKGRLAEAARAAGLLIPQTWLPKHEADVERIAREARFPVIVKPRTQVLVPGRLKGCRVNRREDLVAKWKEACMAPGQVQRLGPSMQGVGRPLIQTCYPNSELIYTVDGFVDRAGNMAVLGCNKLLQHPRRVGPGIIFDDAPVSASVVAGLERLWRATGFFGVFDIECVVDGAQRLLIDLNPRFYNHMAFETDRGLPLSWMAYLGAIGDEATLAAELDAARRHPPCPRHIYVHSLPTRLMLTLQGLAGNMSREERREWRAWIRERAEHVTYPAGVPGDRMPGFADYLFHAVEFLKHPRSFLRHLWRDEARLAGAAKSSEVDDMARGVPREDRDVADNGT